MNVWKKVYGICFFALCLCPSLGMFWAKTDSNTENRTLSEIPQLKSEEDGWNLNWLSDLGVYFQDHFAYRQKLVTANAVLQGKVLGVSTVQSVVQGKNDWLYYNDSVRDFLGSEILSDRSIYNIARSLKITQDHLETQGVKFLFAIAPNKNSLYGENMPYYDSLKVEEENNRVKITKVLNDTGVNFEDLYSLFSSENEVLYHERDSHWNNKGAMMACDAMLSAVGKVHTSYAQESFEIRKDFEGDLDKMLYPEALTPEDEIYYDKPMTYTYVQEIGSTFDPKISTINPEKDGSLVMYRDSFGNALLPFVAEEYGNAYFSRGVPYQMNDVAANQADTVLVERAERFLPDMAKNPPVLAADPLKPSVLGSEVRDVKAQDVKIERQGLFYKISGKLSEEAVGVTDHILIRVDGQQIYEAFPLDIPEGNRVNPYGFCLYIPVEADASEDSVAEIFVTSENITIEDYDLPEETVAEEDLTEIPVQEEVVQIEAVG